MTEFSPQSSNGELLRHDFPNQHVWVVHAVFRLNEAQVIAVHNFNESVPLDVGNLAMTTPVICHRCELPWLVAHAEPCKGTPSETIVAEAEKRLAEYEEGA